jgi:hypothetical protein
MDRMDRDRRANNEPRKERDIICPSAASPRLVIAVLDPGKNNRARMFGAANYCPLGHV